MMILKKLDSMPFKIGFQGRISIAARDDMPVFSQQLGETTGGTPTDTNDMQMEGQSCFGNQRFNLLYLVLPGGIVIRMPIWS